MASDVLASLRAAQLHGRPHSRRVQAAITSPLLSSLYSSDAATHYLYAASTGVPAISYTCDYGHEYHGTHLLLVGDEAGQVSFLDTNQIDAEPLLLRMQTHRNAVLDVKWHPSERKMVTASGDRTARLWDCETQVGIASFTGHYSSVKCVSFDPFNVNVFAICSRDGTILIWDTRYSSARSAGGESSYQAARAIQAAHGPSNGGSSLATSGQAKRRRISAEYTLASAGANDGALRIWDTRSIRTVRGESRPAAESIDMSGSTRKYGIATMVVDEANERLYALSMNNSVYVYHTRTLAPLTTLKSPGFSASFYSRLSLDPHGRWLAAGSSGEAKAAHIWSVDAPPDRGVMLEGHRAEVTAVCWRRDTQDIYCSLATTSDDATARVWRMDHNIAKQLRQETDLQMKSWGRAKAVRGATSEDSQPREAW
ncbi:hypothetical protein RI367_006389 [Sorochytrium milnesiophthora]